MKHPMSVQKYNGTLEDLAGDIGNLRYDSLAKLLNCIYLKVIGDAEKDANRGRKKLASKLLYASDYLIQASQEFSRAWVICKPYAKEEK